MELKERKDDVLGRISEYDSKRDSTIEPMPLCFPRFDEQIVWSLKTACLPV